VWQQQQQQHYKHSYKACSSGSALLELGCPALQHAASKAKLALQETISVLMSQTLHVSCLTTLLTQHV
jgi:hypothetical protein